MEVTIFLLLFPWDVNEEEECDVNLRESTVEDISGHVGERNRISLLSVASQWP